MNCAPSENYTISLPELEQIDRALAQSSLREFIAQAWSIIEPGTIFRPGRHIDAIVEHLEAVTRGQISDLLINVPPRFMKSLIVSVLWPAWEWAKKPSLRYLCAAYAEKLSIRDSLKCRRVVESRWYKRNWGDRVKLTIDQNAKGRFENTATGYRIAMSCGGATTGEGGDRLVMDDPHNVMDAFSDVAMTTAIEWYDEAWSIRVNDPKTAAKVVIMQRISEKDLSAHLIRKGGYEELILPMHFDSKRKCITGIGWEDWRKTDGELLWPERFNEADVTKIEHNLGRYGAAGQLEQIPSPRGGGILEKNWFEIVKAAPMDGATLIRYWDRAASKDSGDYTCGLLMMRARGGVFYILDLVRIQGTPFEVETAIQNTGRQDNQRFGFPIQIVLEQDPAQAGKAEVAHLIRGLAGFNVKAKPVGNKTKEARVLLSGGVASQAQAGNVKIVEARWAEGSKSWVNDFLEEISVFPMGRHDDIVDTLSGAFNELTAGRVILLA